MYCLKNKPYFNSFLLCPFLCKAAFYYDKMSFAQEGRADMVGALARAVTSLHYDVVYDVVVLDCYFGLFFHQPTTTLF